MAVIEMKMYGTTFKGIYRLFLDITRTFIQIITFPLNFISLKIYKLSFLAKFNPLIIIRKYNIHLIFIK